MDTLMALQNLAVTVNNLKESIDLTAIRVSSISNSNNTRASQYHSTFSELLSKYSGFAVNYKFELDNLHKSLLNDINLQQKERERQEREFQEKLESLSNKSTHSNLEIVENVEETEYHSSANSVNNMSSLAPNSPQQYESETNTASMEIPSTFPSNPEPMKSKKSVPISPPNPATTPKRKTKSNKQKSPRPAAPKSKVATKPKSSRKTKKSPASTPKPKASKPMVVRTVTAEIEQKNQNEAPEQEDKYVYRADKIRFARDFPCKKYDEDTGEFKAIAYRHTTMIYIGNIPSNIKIAAVKFFVMKKFKVTMRQIEETKLQKGRGFTQYALVRFRSDVGLDKITKCMEMVNSENAQIKEDKKKAKDTMHVAMKKSSKTGDNDASAGKSKKKLRTSWQTRVFIKFQDPEYHYRYYDTEDDMYNDSRAKHALFIRNFDILNTKCHKELTDLLLTFGDLVKDINIRLDAFGDPFCIVIFKYLNEAIYCCNSDVYFNGRRLEMRYSKF